MNLRKDQELKKKMLEVNPGFMREKFDSGIDRANEARRRLQEHFERIESSGITKDDAGKIEKDANNLALGVNHAVFTYNPHDPAQARSINDVMVNANKDIQSYGESLNKVIHNYPRVAAAFDHIYDITHDYYEVGNGLQNQGAQRNQQNEVEIERNMEPEYKPSPEPQYPQGPRPGM